MRPITVNEGQCDQYEGHGNELQGLKGRQQITLQLDLPLSTCPLPISINMQLNRLLSAIPAMQLLKQFAGPVHGMRYGYLSCILGFPCFWLSCRLCKIS